MNFYRIFGIVLSAIVAVTCMCIFAVLHEFVHGHICEELGGIPTYTWINPDLTQSTTCSVPWTAEASRQNTWNETIGYPALAFFIMFVVIDFKNSATKFVEDLGKYD